LKSTAPASTWSAVSACGAVIFQRSPSLASVTAPFGLSISICVTLSRSNPTSV